MESDESDSDVAVVSPQNQPSDLSVINSPRPNVEPTADQNSSTAAEVISGETVDARSDSSPQDQEPGTEDASDPQPAEESGLGATPGSQAGGEAEVNEAANPYQLAQTETEPHATS